MPFPFEFFVNKPIIVLGNSGKKSAPWLVGRIPDPSGDAYSNFKMTDTDLRKKIIEIMERLRFFDIFSPPEKRKIVDLHAHFRVYQENDVIIQEGSKGTAMFVLLSGTVWVSKGDNSRLQIELTPGEIFGEIAFLTDTDRTADVTAKSVVIALELDKKILFELDPPIREKFKDKIIEKLVQRLQYMNNTFLEPDGPEALEPPACPAFLQPESKDDERPRAQTDPEDLLGGKEHPAKGMPLKQALLKNARNSPPMPDVLVKAQRILENPESGPQQLAPDSRFGPGHRRTDPKSCQFRLLRFSRQNRLHRKGHFPFRYRPVAPNTDQNEHIRLTQQNPERI